MIISDVHANLTALQAVLVDAGDVDQVWCLGDIVGYGPDPNECIELIRSLPGLKCVKGNHDAAILGEIDTQTFNDEARVSLEWLEGALSAENFSWLEALEEKITLETVTLVHGSPRSPVWEYVMDRRVARENMKLFDTLICLVGHTHIPCIFKMEDGIHSEMHLYMMAVDKPFGLQEKSIVNPGSVGQPRDRNPLASYLIYDDDLAEGWVYRRVAYDVAAVQSRIMAAGLPVRHASRLKEGW